MASSKERRPGGLTDLSENATRDISAALNGLLADVFALYLKTQNFHWQWVVPIFATIIFFSMSKPIRSSKSRIQLPSGRASLAAPRYVRSDKSQERNVLQTTTRPSSIR